MQDMETFHEKLKAKLDKFVHLVYEITKRFPKSELYGATSQIRRAALSAMLNYVEGYARKRRLVKINFFEISYGSMQECGYLLDFALKEGWLASGDYDKALGLNREASAMLWKTIEGLENKTD